MLLSKKWIFFVMMMLPSSSVGLATTTTPQTQTTRRGLLATALFAPALASASVYTKADYCRQSDAETKRGIAYGCEEYATDPEKIASMGSRALEEVGAAAVALDGVKPITSARDGAELRQTLRLGALSSLRRDGKRLIVLDKADDVKVAFEKAIAAIEKADLAARRLELDDGTDALLTANDDLAKAQGLLRAFVDVAIAAASGEGTVSE